MTTSESSVGPTTERTLSEKVSSSASPLVMVKLAALQFLGTSLLSLILFVCIDAYIAISAFLGGLIAVLTSLYMASRLFATRTLSNAPEMLVRFYSSIVLKVLFTLSMMAICIFFIKVSIIPFIIAYLLAAVLINLLFLLVPVNDVIVAEDHTQTGRERI